MVSTPERVPSRLAHGGRSRSQLAFMPVLPDLSQDKIPRGRTPLHSAGVADLQERLTSTTT